MTQAKVEKMIEMLKAAGVKDEQMLEQVDALLRSMGFDPATLVYDKE